MKAADYITDSEFKTFATLWCQQQLPIEFIDWLLDRGLDLQAEAVKAALSKNVGYAGNIGYLRPIIDSFRGKHYKWGIEDGIEPKIRCHLEKEIANNIINISEYDTAEVTIAKYLDAYAESKL